MITQHPQAINATKELIHDLEAALSDVSFDQMTRLLYSTDASIYQMLPVGVVKPRDTDEIVAAVEIAKAHQVPILPRGGGSSLAGQAVGHALILDLSRYMNNVIEINAEEKTVIAQPGLTLGKLNLHLQEYNLLFGPDPASADRATLGGIVGNNSTGAHSIIYGMTHDHTLSVDTVLADGSRAKFSSIENEWDVRGKLSGLEGQIYRNLPEILSSYKDEISTRYPNTFRHVSGYNLHLLSGMEQPNLASLIVGSEGSLSVVSEMTLNLVPIPKVKRLAMVHFSDLREAMDAVPVILESNPTAVEVIDKMLVDLMQDRIEHRKLLTFVEGHPEIILLVEYAGSSDSELDAGIQNLKRKLNQIRHKDTVVIISGKKEQANVWYVRKLGLGILMSIRGDAKPIPFIEDAAVPVEHLADYVTQIYDFAYSTGIERVAMYGHASAGCLHIRPMVNLKKGAGVRQLRQVAEKSLELIIKYGETMSGEHGDGIVRGEFLEKQFGKKMVEAFKEVKATFDPTNMMNPGKVVNVPLMDDQSLLRFGTNYSVPLEPVQSKFNFDNDGGFLRAVEMCNGAGVCRKLDHGVMCPSFKVTQNEMHSTRGRANALRSAMMGMLGDDAMSSHELYDVFDLCISCHACHSECPSAVDMAKIKSEFLYQYYQSNSTPLRSRVFANIGKINKLFQPFASLINWLLNGPGKLGLSLLGIHPKRSLPKLVRQTFSAWHSGQNDREKISHKQEKQVVFFHDTFMEFNDPQIGRAAIKVLKAAGYQPIVLNNKVDSGRPAVSKGLLDEAERLARHNMALLAPYAKQGIPIVGCEPSAMAMLIKEYPELIPGEDTKIIAENTLMIDQFLVQEVENKDISFEFDGEPRNILFHGHCQQKAFFGTESVHKMLELIPNTKVEEVETSCCGMAGSFGYEKEHYKLSIQMAELSLAPAVRSAGEKTIISAMGTSCRDQIKHTAESSSLHPIEIFADALLID